MAIARTLDWRLMIPPEVADSRIRNAFASLELDPEGAPGIVTGHSKAKLLKNRWAADVTATIKPYQTGSLVELRVEMPAGSQHYAVANDIAKAIGDDAFDDRGLTAAMDRLSGISKVAGWLDLRNVRNYLTATETVVDLGQGVWDNKEGLVVLTDERLFFFDKSLIGATVQEFPLDSITSVTANKKLGGESLAITVAGNVSSISRMMHGQADALARSFREVKAQAKSAAAPSPIIIQQASSADELVKLADLRDKGILTEEEFAAAKAKALGI